MGAQEQSNPDASASSANTHHWKTTTVGDTTTATPAATPVTATTTTTKLAAHVHLPKVSPPPQIIVIPATQASTVATNAAKKIRRAFSMPRNPFRWSRKFKTSSATMGSESSADGSHSAVMSCVGGGRGRAGSIVSLSSYEAVCKDTNGNVQGEGNKHGDPGQKKNVKPDSRSGKQQQQQSAASDESGTVGVGGIGGAAAAGLGTTSASNRVLRRSSIRKFLNRIAQHVSSTVNVGAAKQAASAQGGGGAGGNALPTGDRVPPIGCYQWPADQTPGVMGLKNHGNTCFMNAVLQCLSHTDILAEYFVLDQYKADLKRRNKINSRKFGTKGELTEQLANVLKALWTCKNESDHSTSFKAVVDRYGSQFRSSTQHDAQEFLFWLLDKVHEDLNTATKRRYKSVKNTYGRPDEILAAETLANHIRCNNSFVQAVFQAQFRSSLTCPRCRKQSNTFDPFHCISVQLPQLTQESVYVTVVYLKRHPQQVRLGLTVPAGSPIVALREQLHSDTGIATNRMVLVDINKSGFTRVFFDSQPVATLTAADHSIYCIEVADESTEPELKPSSTATMRTTAARTGETVAASISKKNDNDSADLLLLVANVRKKKKKVEQKDDQRDDKKLKKISEQKDEKDDESAIKAVLNDVSSSEEKKTELKEEKKLNENDVEKEDDSDENVERFGAPFSMKAPRDCSYPELQKRLLREMSALLKPEVFSYTTPLLDMFQIRLQDPSADPDTYLEQVEHPLLTEMIDLALSVLSAEAGPPHIKLLLEWAEPEQYFTDLTDTVAEHESVVRLRNSKPNDTATLSLEQCLEHYTKAETLSAEDAWRCPHCQQYLPVVKTLGLWSLPDILVVHFKRFRQHHEKGANAAKLTTMVKFPLNAFDMSPHLARATKAQQDALSGGTTAADVLTASQNSYRPSPWKKPRSGDSRSSTLTNRENTETRYDLYAVCYHQGDTLETGHYTAACKNPYDRQWYKFDDQRVSKVPDDSIQEEIINNEAYMLFYQRRTGDTGECSGSSSNSGDHWVSKIAPVPQLPAEKLLLSQEQAEEEPAISAEIKVEPIPENKKIEDCQPIENDHEEIKPDSKETFAADETLAQKVVNSTQETGHCLVDIDYADAEAVDTIDEEEDELQALETVSNKELDVDGEDHSHVFVMDEDCHINEAVENHSHSVSFDTKAQVEATTNAIKMPSAAILKTKSPPLATNEKVISAAEEGHKFENTLMPNGKASPRDSYTNGRASKTPSSASSSVSSISSRSSPHSLAVTISGACALQTKLNGFSASSSSANNYKEVLLSSSLKSNSSSIIGATAAGHSHEFHLSRHQHQHWNGSRSSVSAVENGTQQKHAHGPGLNLRHSFSTSSNYKLRECSETLSSMLRNSTNTCSKDTLLFIDQQNHHHHNHHSLMEDEDDAFMGSRALWISPVTPHKLITVSPKN